MSDIDMTAIDAIVHVLADYRRGEIAPIDGAWVRRWSAQFPLAARPVILRALARALPRMYLSRAQATEFCVKLLASQAIWGADSTAAVARTGFLNLQPRGHSQSAMLQLCDDVALLW